MSIRFHVIPFLVVVSIWATPARSQEASDRQIASPYLDPETGLGLEAAIERALAQEPGLRALRAEIDVARGLRQQAGLRPNPTLTAEHRGEPGGTDSLTTVGMEWPLDLFRAPGRTRAADRSIDVAQYGAEDRRRLLLAEVRLRYGAAVAATRDLVVADGLLTTARRQLDLIRERVDAGASPPLDRDLLEVEVRRLEADQLLAGGRAESAIAQLKPLLGMSSDEPLRLRDSLDTLVASSMTEATDPTGTAARRSDVREAEARVTLSDARIDQARREGRADVSLFGSYMRMDNGFPQQGIAPDGSLERVRGRFNYAAAGAAVTIPFRNRNQGQIAASQAEKVAAEARRDALELAAGAEVSSAAARDRQAQAAFRIYRESVRELARRNLEVVRQTFELGRATVFDVIAEQRRFIDVERAHTMAAREAWEARTELKRATGETR